MRVIADPKDVRARLALATLADKLGMPSVAIEQLEAVDALGGPLGTRWHADDRARLARLIAVRGRLRLARGAPSPLGDFTRPREPGAAIADDELRVARPADALANLTHVDRELHDSGKRVLAELASKPGAPCTTTLAKRSSPTLDATDAIERSAQPCIAASWRGADPKASLADRGAFGAWLW